MSFVSTILGWFTHDEASILLPKDAVAFHRRRNKVAHNAAVMAQLIPIWSMSDELLRVVDWSEGTLRTVRTGERRRKYKEVVMISLPHQWFELIYDDKRFVASSYALGNDGIVYHYSRDSGGWGSTEHYQNIRFLEEIRNHLYAACRQRGVHVTYEVMGEAGAHIGRLVLRKELGIL